MLIDSHCHLSSEEIYENLPQIMDRAKEAGIDYMLNAGGKFDDLATQLRISDMYAQVFTATGVHPHDAKDYSKVVCADVLKNTHYNSVVAIGECGLDYFYDFSPKDEQIKIFKEMIKASQESGLPLIVHSREAESDTAELLTEAYKKKPFSGVLHCYSSKWELAQAVLDIGLYVSASGMITFNKSEELRENFKKVPNERLLVETDSPYLAPKPLRGKINEPSFIVHTTVCLGQIKGLDLKQISDITVKNFFNLFKKAQKIKEDY